MLLCFPVFKLQPITIQLNSKCHDNHNYIKYGLKEYLLTQNSLFLKFVIILNVEFCAPFNFREHEKECEKLWKLSHCVILSNMDFVSPSLKNRKTPESLGLCNFQFPLVSVLFKYPGYKSAPLLLRIVIRRVFILVAFVLAPSWKIRRFDNASKLLHNSNVQNH